MSLEATLALAADIRRVDGNHDLGAAALAERLVEAGWIKAGWRDIASAPKDGTFFLGYWPDVEEMHVVCIRNGQCEREMDNDSWMMSTHWMPLPPSPAAERKSATKE